MGDESVSTYPDGYRGMWGYPRRAPSLSWGPSWPKGEAPMTDTTKFDSEFERLDELLPPFRVEEREGLTCPRCGVYPSPGVLVRPVGEQPILCAGCFTEDAARATRQSAGEGWNVERPPPIDGKRFKKAYEDACAWYRKPVDGEVSQEFYNDLNGRMTTDEMEVGFRRAQARHEFFPTSQQVRDAGRVKP